MSEDTILRMSHVESIVYMDKDEGWAVVTKDNARLGIRWFSHVEQSPGQIAETGASNFPTGPGGHPVWLELPICLHESILSGLGEILVAQARKRLG